MDERVWGSIKTEVKEHPLEMTRKFPEEASTDPGRPAGRERRVPTDSFQIRGTQGKAESLPPPCPSAQQWAGACPPPPCGAWWLLIFSLVTEKSPGLNQALGSECGVEAAEELRTHFSSWVLGLFWEPRALHGDSGLATFSLGLPTL